MCWEVFRKFTVDLCFIRGKHILRKDTQTAWESHCMGSHMGPKPTHLNDVVVSRYHRARTFFFPGRSVSYLHPLPSPPLGIQHQGDSPNRAGKRLSPWTTRLFSSEGWSLNIYHVHWLVHMPAIRKKKRVWGCQHLEYCAFRSFVLFFFSENQMGMCCWVCSPKRTHRGHLWERLALLLEDLSSSFSPVVKTFISRRNSFCWGNCSRFQFLIYVVIFGKYPFE